MKRRRKRARRLSIPERASRILNIVLVAFFLILIRLWYLTVVQHDDSLEQARRPQRRLVVEKADRGTIRDRFNIPLAINKVQYNAAILYSDIREIPRTGWGPGRQRRYPRRDYISQLSQKLADELDLEADRIEDLIYSRAALFPNVPYVIAEGISESDYCRLRAMEFEWPGLCAERGSVRCYPQGKVACDLLGYVGSISAERFEKVASEIRRLRDYLEARDEGKFPPLPEGMESTSQVCERLADLRERAYSIHDQVGRGGIELTFDEQLRGYRGQRLYLSDIYGNYLRPLPGGQEALPGKRVILSISAELQEFAEHLLIQSEQLREGTSVHIDRDTRSRRQLKQPWIKGGAIVAMEPNSGEIVALASYPRFDPGDLAHGKEVVRWMELDALVGEIWDQKRPLCRESYCSLTRTVGERQLEMTWPNYIDAILPPSNFARKQLERMTRVEDAARLQQLFAHVLDIAEGWQPREVMDALYSRDVDLPFSSGSGLSYVEADEWLLDPRIAPLQKELDGYLASIPKNYDKLLVIDLCRLAVDPSSYVPSGMTIEQYRSCSSALVALEQVARDMARGLFHDLDFHGWREKMGKEFLREKRRLEKERGSWQRPYLDYFDRKERELFADFWLQRRLEFVLALACGANGDDPYLAHFNQWHRELEGGAHRALEWIDHYDTLSSVCAELGEQALSFCRGLRSYAELDGPLLGRYRYLRSNDLKGLAGAFYPRYGFGFGRSFAFRQAAPQGSIFKLITAYEAVRQHYNRCIEEKGICLNPNPLTIVDDVHRREGKGWNVGFFDNGRPIPMFYKGGRIIPTLRRHVGEIGLVGAMEVSSNSYFALLIGDHLEQPSDVKRAAEWLSYGSRTGIDLPGEYPGRLPEDLDVNPSGAYAFSIGQHSMVVTPLQTAVALSAIANGGRVQKPKIVSLLAGADPVRSGEALFDQEEYPFRESLEQIGIGFPLFTAAGRGALCAEVTPIPEQLLGEIPLEEDVRKILLESLQATVLGSRGGARPTAARSYRDLPWITTDYKNIKEHIVGKTSTAEIVENVDLDADWGTNTYNHIWFAGISFEEGDWDRPELVVVVYLRFADYGRETAPLAAQIVKRWREIREKDR